MAIPDEKRRLCADNALKCFGTAYIFERRGSDIRWKIRIVNFLGIAGPASLGAVLAMLGLQSPYLPIAITVAGAVALVQVIAAIWSLVAGWDTSLAYAIESKSENYRLASEFEALGKTTTLTDDEFESELKDLETRADFRSDLDNRMDVSDKEKRRGLRAGLRKFQRVCAVCGDIPVSMKPTKPCPACDNF